MSSDSSQASRPSVELVPSASWKPWFSGKDGESKEGTFLGAHVILVPVVTCVCGEDGYTLTRRKLDYSIGLLINDVYGGNVALTGEVFFLFYFCFERAMRCSFSGFEESSDPASSGISSDETPSSFVWWF
jgi:hypothetical protein